MHAAVPCGRSHQHWSEWQHPYVKNHECGENISEASRPATVPASVKREHGEGRASLKGHVRAAWHSNAGATDDDGHSSARASGGIDVMHAGDEGASRALVWIRQAQM